MLFWYPPQSFSDLGRDELVRLVGYKSAGLVLAWRELPSNVPAFFVVTADAMSSEPTVADMVLGTQDSWIVRPSTASVRSFEESVICDRESLGSRVDQVSAYSGTVSVVVQHYMRPQAVGWGVANSRDPISGEGRPTAEWQDGSGRVVKMMRRPAHPRAEEMSRLLTKIEHWFGFPVEVEFCATADAILLVQVGPMTATARARWLWRTQGHGVTAFGRQWTHVKWEEFRGLFLKVSDPPATSVSFPGVIANPGWAIGRVALTDGNEVTGPRIVVAPDLEAGDLPILSGAMGLITAQGGITSHASVMARGLGIPCLVSVAGLGFESGKLRFGDYALDPGEWITVDGSRGLVYLGAQPYRFEAIVPGPEESEPSNEPITHLVSVGETEFWDEAVLLAAIAELRKGGSPSSVVQVSAEFEPIAHRYLAAFFAHESPSS